MVVKSEELLNNAVQAVRDWVRGLPTGVVTLEEEVTNYEHVLSILPRHQASAPVTFRLNTRASFGLYIGSCIRVEELPLSIENMLEICNAAYNGFVEEDRWLIGETPIKICGVIRLPSGVIDSEETLGFPLPGQNTTHLHRQYHAYS